MLRAFSLSLGQLGDPAVLKTLALTTVATLALFALAGVGLWQMLTLLTAWPGWDGQLAAIGAVAVIAVLGWLLFRIVAIAVMGVFVDRIVAAVEREHYPEASGTACEPPLTLSLRLALGSIARALLFNLLALPLYLVLLITGVGSVLLFAGVNALLLGRDLGEMVAVRHLPRGDIKRWLERTRGPRLVLGAIVTGLLMLPFVNFLAPIVGAAMATHLYHRKLGAALDRRLPA